MIETFNLEISLLCFESNFLERKIQGLKSLLEIMKNIKYNNLKFLNIQIINTIIDKNELFEKIYGVKGHIELIKRSADFLKYMINENLIVSEQLDKIWAATKTGVTEAKLSIYKVLTEVGLSLKTDQLYFIITKISEIPPTELISDEIELVYELSKFSVRASNFIKKSRNFYWNLITESKYYTPEILDLALNKFCDIMKSWELKDERYGVLIDCVSNIEKVIILNNLIIINIKDISILSSIKIAKKLIEIYPSSPSITEKFTKNSIIDHLVQEKNLINILIDVSLLDYMKLIKL